MIRILFDRAETFSGVRVFRDGVQLDFVRSVTLLPFRRCLVETIDQPLTLREGQAATTTVEDEWFPEGSGK